MPIVPLLGDADGGGAGVYGNALLSAQFWCELKTALRK